MTETRGLKSLENWAKKVTSNYNNVNVTNMSSSFRDGLAFCAIIHHYHPDLIDFDSLSKENILHNNSLAFNIAEKKLGVPALLDAEDMVTYSVPDKLSIITYLSQLHNCFENQNRASKIRKKQIFSQENSFPSEAFVRSSTPSAPRSHELCCVCQHRVFILERQIVSGKLYHRTCFRCFKCNSLLQPGAYVESDEKVGLYECANCPHDEPKELQINIVALRDVSSHGGDSSNENTPSVTPEVSPDLPLLSSKLNAARNTFLSKNVRGESESEQLSVSSKSSSEESVNQETTNSNEQQNLDSGFNERNTSDDVQTEVLQSTNLPVVVPLKPMRQVRYLKPLSSDILEDVKTDPDRKPYQSVFTRKILHTTSLSSLSRTHKLDSSSINVLNSKPVSDIPIIRPFSYTPTPVSSELHSSIFTNTVENEVNEIMQEKLVRRKSLDSSGPNEVGDVSETKCENERMSLTSVKHLIQIFGEKDSNSDFKVSSGTLQHDSKISDVASFESSKECKKQEETKMSDSEDNQFAKMPETESSTEKNESLPDSVEITTNFELADEVRDRHQNESKNTNFPDFNENELYPDDLNPFGDDEDQTVKTPVNTPNKSVQESAYPDSLNPFGESDDDCDQKSRVQVVCSDYDESKNPFAFDEDDEVSDPAIKKTPITSVVTPKSIIDIKSSPRSPTGSISRTLKKRKAPAAPSVKELFLNTSNISEKSVISSPSPVKLSPRVHKHKQAPPPPSPSLSNKSDSIENNKNPEHKRKKRPAPPVPIPRRREIKKIPLSEIKSEMSEIEEKQIQLEEHGRELEVLIRDRDKDEEPTVEEEEYIIQLFELVNQKNALFRRQAELMYIKRSQRLEEDQVELEFQIRSLMTKPASKKTIDDKKLEEKLLEQLLDVVDQRNEIVDTIEMDRLREQEEDTSIHDHMEIKNGELPIAAEIKEKQKKKTKKHKEKKKKKNKEVNEEYAKDKEIEKKGTLRKKWF